MDYEYDVAISFAGEDRTLAKKIASLLKKINIAVFYDDDEQHYMLGKNLVEFLADVYGKRARHCLVLVSKHYAEKEWPSHERRVALERALQDRDSDYLLPIRVDDTALPGFLNQSIGYLDHRRMKPKEIVDVLVKKLRLTRTKTGAAALLKLFELQGGPIRHASQLRFRNTLALLHPGEGGSVRLYLTVGRFRAALRDVLSDVIPDLVSIDSELVPLFYEDVSGIGDLFVLDRQRRTITGHIDKEAEDYLEPYYIQALERAIDLVDWKVYTGNYSHVSIKMSEDDYYGLDDMIRKVDINTDEFGYVGGLVLADSVPFSTTFRRRTS